MTMNPLKSHPPARSTDAFARMLRLARPEWRLLGLATLLLFVGSGAQLLVPRVMGALVDQATVLREPHAIDRATLQMLALFAVVGVAGGLRYVAFTVVGERVVARLRADCFARLLEQEIAFFDATRTGELSSRLGSDTGLLQASVSAHISMGLRHTTTIVGGLFLLAYTSLELTALLLTVMPPIVVAGIVYRRRLRGLSRKVQDALADSAVVAEETLSGIRTVRSFAAEPLEERRYRSAVMASLALAKRRVYLAGTFMGAAQFLVYAAVALVLWSGSRSVLSGELTLGALTSYLVYAVLVASSLGAYSELWTELNKAAGASQRVFALLDREPAMPARGGTTLPEVRGELRFDDVWFQYPARPDAPVLRGVDVRIAPGEQVALVGPSGAGKSTIAALVSRLYDPTRGQITLDGQDLRALDPSWLRSRIGTVAQEPVLFGGSIEDNIRYARPSATGAEVEAAARAAHAHEFIVQLPDGYRTLVGERGIRLSGGQKQRIAIARAVLKDPRILVLDEATSALDAESERLVKEALEHLTRSRTTLIIAHRLSTVIDADRVLVIEDGKVVQAGSHALLMREDGLYRRLVERQFVAA